MDEAFRVTNGEVREASRATPEENRIWTVGVRPDAREDVTIELPATTDCSAAGAVCAKDGRPLSNSVTATVAAQPASAQANGPLLTLAWPTPRDGFAAPDGPDFAVRVDGDLRAVTAVSLWRRSAVLALAEPVRPGQEVLVDYVGSAMHPLRDVFGAREAAWSDLAAVNVTGLPGGEDDLLAQAQRDGAWPSAADGMSASFTGLELRDADLAGLAVRPDLRRLDLSGNALSDLSALAGLRDLRSLDLSGNALSDLSPLAGLTELRLLDLSDNRISDLWPVDELPHLEVLLLDGNRVADVGAVTHLHRLESLGLSGNRIADVAPLADLRSLRRLDLGGNPVSDLSPVGDLQSLVLLRLPAAQGEAPTERLVRLRWLLAPDALGACLSCAVETPVWSTRPGAAPP